MELAKPEWEASEAYLSPFDSLMGDQRTCRTFREVIYGIIAGESLRTSRIARFSPWVSRAEVWG